VPVSGGSRAVPALTSGSVQFCVMAGGPAANAVLAGADLVVVGSLLDTYAYNFVAADSIKTAADLKGKAVGVSTPGSASAVAMDIALERLGLRPGDVTVLALGDYRQRFSAMEAGYIAGSIFDYPDAEIARQHGLRTLLDMTPLELPTLQIALVTTRAYLTAHRATVLQFVKAISHALAAIRHDRAGGIAALARHTGLDAREYAAVLDRTYTAVFQERLKSTPAISLDAARAALAEAARNHPKASPNGPEDLADLSIVEELTQSGFFAGLTP
jgi:NitT/TauT family transport system substrate-binding protein